MRADARVTVPTRSADGGATLAWLAAAVTLADLLTKQIAVARLAHAGLALGDTVRLTLLHNHGLAWGLSGGGQALAITLAGTALLLGAVAAVRRPLAIVDPTSPRMLGLVVGAALGNAISLLLWPGAPDFIALDVGGGTETVINVADVALFVGLALCCRTTWRVAIAARAERERRPTLVPTVAHSLARRAPRPIEREIPLVVAREREPGRRVDQARRAPGVERESPSAPSPESRG